LDAEVDSQMAPVVTVLHNRNALAVAPEEVTASYSFERASVIHFKRRPMLNQKRILERIGLNIRKKPYVYPTTCLNGPRFLRGL
jgi:hypothetical protein